MIDIDHQQALLMQRAAVIRAVKTARKHGAENDAELLETVVHLLEELHDRAPRARVTMH